VEESASDDSASWSYELELSGDPTGGALAAGA